jgi:hypothetical protein
VSKAEKAWHRHQAPSSRLLHTPAGALGLHSSAALNGRCLRGLQPEIFTKVHRRKINRCLAHWATDVTQNTAVNNNIRVITPYNLMLFCNIYSIMLFKCNNWWKKTSLLGGPQCEYSRLLICRKSGYCQPGFSCQPQTYLAARQADRQPRLRVIDPSPVREPWNSRESFSRSYRSCLELGQGGPNLRSELL